MAKEELKKVHIQLRTDVWKRLKIRSIQKEITFSELVRDILETHMSSKRNTNNEEVDT
jgi:macrodomain Ter protein organizer (MatP/YcbG family)